jgi:transcriptional regulator with XRE-family HTH domain
MNNLDKNVNENIDKNIDKNIDSILRKIVKDKRKELGLTLDAVSKKVGLSISFVSDIENGRKVIPAKNLDGYAEVLGIEKGEMYRMWMESKIKKGVKEKIGITDLAPIIPISDLIKLQAIPILNAMPIEQVEQKEQVEQVIESLNDNKTIDLEIVKPIKHHKIKLVTKIELENDLTKINEEV